MKKKRKIKNLGSKLSLGLGVVTAISAVSIPVTNHEGTSKNNPSYQTNKQSENGLLTTNQQDIDAITVDDLNLPLADDSISAETIVKPVDGVTANGVNYSFTTWNTNVGSGTIEWKVSLTKGIGTREMSGTIRGYRFFDQEDVDRTDIADVHGPDFYDPSNIKASSVAKPADGVTWRGVKYVYTQWEVDDVKGVIDYKIMLSKGEATKELHWTFTGCLTNDQEIVNAVSAQDINLPDANYIVTASSTSPPPDGVTASGVKYTFIEWKADDSKGEIKWTAKLSKGDASRQLEGEKGGYYTLDQQDVDSVSIEQINAAIELDPKLLLSETYWGAPAINLWKEPIGNGVTISLTLTTFNDFEGSADWTADLWKNGATRTVTGTKFGWRKWNDREAVDHLYYWTPDFNKLIPDEPNRLPSDVTSLASGFSAETGVNYSFTIRKRDDYNGTIEWSGYLSRGDAKEFIEGTKPGI